MMRAIYPNKRERYPKQKERAIYPTKREKILLNLHGRAKYPNQRENTLLVWNNNENCRIAAEAENECAHSNSC